MRPDVAIDASRSTAAERTGTEWYSFQLIEAMISLANRPDLLLYHRERQHAHASATRVRHRHVTAPRLWTHVGLSAAVIRDRPMRLFVPAHVIPIVHPRVSVVTIHDLGYIHEPGAHPKRARQMLDLTTRWNAKVARRVIAVSGQTRDDLVNHYRVPSSRIDVIYSGVDHERFHPGRDTTSDELPPGIRPPYLLFVSTIQPRKNLDRLLTAFKTLDRPDLQLVVAGRSGWMSGDTELRMTDGSIENIKRMGYVASHHLAALYRQASAYVLPSLYEGFGLGVLEAMASGCPVVVSNRSSLPEIAGNAGVLVDPLDIDSIRCGILTAMDPQIRQRLIVSGIERAASFTWQRTAEMTIDTINCASTGTS